MYVCVRVYIRWDWETTLARLRPLLSITGVAGEPVLPELCLRVRTRPGQHGRERRRSGLKTQTDSVCLPSTLDRRSQTDEDLDEGGGQTPPN